MRKRTVAVAVIAGACGAVIGLTTVAVGAPRNRGGTLTLNQGMSVNVTCQNSGALSNSAVAASSETVNCAAPAATTTTVAQTTTTTAPPQTTTTATTMPRTTTTTTAGGGGGGGTGQCTSAPSGSIGPFSYPQISNSNGYNTYVGNNMWGANSGTKQTVCAVNPGNWTMAATAGPSGYTGVQTYPDIQQLFNDYCGSDTWNGCQNMTDTPLADLHSLTSRYSITDPPDSSGVWEAAYDIWLSNSPHSEIMIWVDTSNVRNSDNGSQIINNNVVIDGQTYTYQNYGGGLPQMVLHGNPQSATVNILDVLKYLQSQGQVSANAALGQLDFGWEVCSTVGTENFAVNSFSMTAS